MGAETNNEQFKLENLFNVKGKVALITGGGSGIGLMAVQALAVNGAKVYIVGRTEEKLERVAELYSTGQNGAGQIIPIVADVTKKSDIERLVSDFKSKEDHLSILINNAGISSSARHDTEREHPEALKETLFDNDAATFEDWENVSRTNIAQLFFMTSAFLPLLQKATDKIPGFSSTVINITSISGIIKASQHHFAYNASKAAAIHLTKMLEHEIYTSGLKESDEKQKSELAKEKYEDKVPAQRPGNDRDMGSAVLFAATNQYLNGQTVVVDGGYVLATGAL
ncbi:hypothetical protein F66182_11686 [Fusarium sp. NRRL 66182]|nr:hypothetical protein F66182_11686 [Fusarium sp. NRRL 66182]